MAQTQSRIPHFSIRLVWLGVLLSCGFLPKVLLADSCDRLVSLAPSISEVVYAIGLGKNLVAVTRFDEYPPEVKSLVNIGGFLDPNYEAILAARPSLVLHLSESRDAGLRLGRLGAATLEVSHKSVAGVLDSINAIGSKCDRKSQAEELSIAITSKLKQLKGQLDSADVKRIAVLVGGEDGDLSKLYISGSDGFYTSVLEQLGLENVYEQATAALPGISLEGIFALDPDAILQVVYGNQSIAGKKKIHEAWSKMPALRAVKSNKVFVLDQDYAHIPGPRLVNLAQDISQAFRRASGG